MDVIRFGLGLRFDTVCADGAKTDDEVSSAVSMILSSVDRKLVSGMQLHAGYCKLDEYDCAEVLTVVFMGQGLGRTRRFYNALIKNKSVLDMLTERRPIIQTNAISKLNGLDFYGEFDENGALNGGNKEIDIVVSTKDTDEGSITVLLAPDKFKGTLEQNEVIAILKRAAREESKRFRFLSFPAADGGDGTAKVLSNELRGFKRSSEVTSPVGETISAEYYFLADGTAIVEMANCSGLVLVSEPFDPMEATSRGTGEMLLSAAKAGAKRILLGVGGSATNDGGIGAASALGVRFLDASGAELPAIPASLEKIASIDASALAPEIENVEITVLCDVANPLTGADGATAVFAPQKFVRGEMLTELENGMKNLERLYDERLGKDGCKAKGMGAAGGIGAMLASLLGAKLVSGAEFVLDKLGFDKKLAKADIVVTGEGRFDKTSETKAVGEVLKRAKVQNVPAYVVAGCTGGGYEPLLEQTGAELYRVSDAPPDSMNKKHAEQALLDKAKELFGSVSER